MATIFKRGNSWYLNLSEQGKRVVRSLGPNERLARLRLAEVQADLERGKAGFPASKKKQFLAGRIEEFLATQTAGKAAKTVVRYRECARHFLDFFGPDVDLDSAALRRYIVHRAKQVRSKTVNNELIFIRTVYGAGGSHPFRDVKNLPVRDSKEIRFLSPEEAARLIKACDSGINREQWPDLGDYVAAYLYFGVRLAELGALTWADVTPTGVRVTNLKTHGRRRGDKYRVVPIHPVMVPILARRRKAKLPVPFPAHHPNSLRRGISRAAERAGIAPGVGVHTLRHTFAGTLVSQGVSLYAVSKLMGHSSQETTQIYAHLSPSSLEGAIGLIRYE